MIGALDARGWLCRGGVGGMRTGWLHSFREAVCDHLFSVLRVLPTRGGVRRDELTILKPDRIGDFVLATGAIRVLMNWAASRGRRVRLVVSELAGPIARREFPQAEVVRLPLLPDASLRTAGALLGVWWMNLLRRRSGELVNLRYHPAHAEDVALSLFRAKQSAGCGFSDRAVGRARGKWLRPGGRRSFEYPKVAGPGLCLELEAHRRLLSLVLGRAVDSSEVWPRLESFRTRPGPKLIVFPFSSLGIKDYREDLLIRSLVQAAGKQSLPILLCGERFRQSDLLRILQGLRGSGVDDVEACTPSDAESMCELVSNARCVLTMDSAAAHIAGALRVPVVVILGGGHFGMFGPWTHGAGPVWVYKEMDCYQCDWWCTQPSNRCIHEIAAENVAAALLGCLANTEPC